MLPIAIVWIALNWISPGLREHEDEFNQAWERRYGIVQSNTTGQTGAPKATYKTWYKQWKRTGIGPDDWLAGLHQGPPGSGLV